MTEVTTTMVAATTTTTVPPPYSFDGSVPPPPLNNTGDDFEAIFRSIDDYSNWLFGHNPDPALIGEIVDTGTQQYTAYEDDLTTLADRNLRLYDASSKLDTVAVTDSAERVVLLIVTYTSGEHVITNELGESVDSEPYPGARSLVTLSADDNGRWRLTSTTPAEELPEVEL